MKDDLEFLDILNILSFVIGLMNYNENLTQGDKQELMQALDKQTQILLEDIHYNLEQQNKLLEEIKNEINKKDSETN